MNKRISGLFIALSLFMPALAVAQVTGSSSVDVQVQSLLSQINALQQQLKSLLTSVASSSTHPSMNASSTPPMGMPPGMMVSKGNCSIFTRDLSVGAQGDDVMELQKTLSDDGFLTASTTGFFGPLTAKALMSFKMHFGISASSSPTGFFGQLTRKFLQGRCGQGNGDGKDHPMGTSTMPWPNSGSGDGKGPWMGTSTNGGPMHGPMGSSTPPAPCTNDDQGAAAGLVITHVILPHVPCDGQGPGNQGQQH